MRRMWTLTFELCIEEASRCWRSILDSWRSAAAIWCTDERQSANCPSIHNIVILLSASDRLFFILFSTCPLWFWKATIKYNFMFLFTDKQSSITIKKNTALRGLLAWVKETISVSDVYCNSGKWTNMIYQHLHCLGRPIQETRPNSNQKDEFLSSQSYSYPVASAAKWDQRTVGG